VAKKKKLEQRKIRRERRQKRLEKEKQLLEEKNGEHKKKIENKSTLTLLKDPENIDKLLIIKCLDTGEKFTLRDVDVSGHNSRKPIVAFDISTPLKATPPEKQSPKKEGNCIVQ